MVETKTPLALVTGAAHRLGRAFAVCLGQMGFAILLHYNSAEENARNAAREIETLGVPVYPFKADLTRLEEIDSLFTFLDSLPHDLHVLINSAAVMQRGEIQSLPSEDWDATMSINLRAPFLMAQRAGVRMQAGGLIVNVTDAGDAKTWTGYPAYIISKAGLESLTRHLARAFAPSIRVNAIAPGLVLPAESIPDAEWHKLVARLPLKHNTAIEDVTSALEFLVHNQSITGQTIVVDGGYSLL